MPIGIKIGYLRLLYLFFLALLNASMIFDCRGRSCAYPDVSGGQPQGIAPTNFLPRFSNAFFCCKMKRAIAGTISSNFDKATVSELAPQTWEIVQTVRMAR